MKQILLLSILIFLFLIPCFAQENLSCPNIDVTTPREFFYRDEIIPFAIIAITESKNLKLEYRWKISYGVIEKGQGTPKIAVSTAGLEDTTITATVEIKGLPQNCPYTFTRTTLITGEPTAIFTSHSDDWYAPDMPMRIASVFASMTKYPESRCVIINYGTKKETAKREAELKRLIRQGKHDIKLIEFMRDNTEAGIKTKFFLLPKGAKMPIFYK